MTNLRNVPALAKQQLPVVREGGSPGKRQVRIRHFHEAPHLEAASWHDCCIWPGAAPKCKAELVAVDQAAGLMHGIGKQARSCEDDQGSHDVAELGVRDSCAKLH